LLEQTQQELPEDIKFIGDKAYVGRANTTTPKKKPPKGALTRNFSITAGSRHFIANILGCSRNL
jgi:hypothetical protein